MSLVRIVVLAGLLLCAARAGAATTCSVSTTSLVFGAYDVFRSTPLDSTATVSWSCNNGQPILWLGPGLGTPAQVAIRRMLNGTNALQYGLYLDAARTTVWGDGTGGSSVYTAPGKNGSATIYGRVFARQLTVRAGTYADTVVVTINF